ncbi:MAG: hypothetical protein NNA22_04230 [Nitrospira sp.]|nr:hypothetical protein [Nitrospira sp.]
MTPGLGGDVSGEDVEGWNVRCRMETPFVEESDGLNGVAGESGCECAGRSDGAELSGAAGDAAGTWVETGGEDGEATGATCSRGFVAVSSGGVDGPPGWFDADFGGGGVCGISAVLRETPVTGAEEESGGTGG